MRQKCGSVKLWRSFSSVKNLENVSFSSFFFSRTLKFLMKYIRYIQYVIYWWRRNTCYDFLKASVRKVCFCFLKKFLPLANVDEAVPILDVTCSVTSRNKRQAEPYLFKMNAIWDTSPFYNVINESIDK